MRKSFTEQEMIQAFWSKVDETRTCWIWVGAIDNHGYGKFRYKGRALGAHRIAYMLYYDKDIPEDKQLDHLCRNRSCVNPKHLEIVTQETNIQRGVWDRRKGMCVKGLHKLTPQNTYVNPTTGKTRCITCRNAYRRKYWLEKHDNRR